VTGSPALHDHVGDLDGSSAWVSATKWRAKATIAIEDDAHAAITGATVTGTWTGGTTASCVTKATGLCSVTKRFGKAKASATFTVTSVTSASYTYVPADNRDPDADSNGTTISIARPV